MRCAAGGLALVLVLGGARAEAPFAKETIEWNKPSAAFHIVGNIYYVGTADLAIFLIKTPKGHILIDSGVPKSPPLIEKNIASLGVKLSDIKILITSHGHFDHAGGVAQLKKDTGAIVVAGAADKTFLELGHVTYGPSEPIQFAPVHVDRAVKDGDTIKLGGVTMTALHTPGHTPGCTSWTMPVSEKGVTYQVLFFCSSTVGGNPLVHNAVYPQIASDFRATFARLKKMHIDVFLPAHARFFNAHAKAAKAKAGGPNPFVDPGEFHRYMTTSEQEFEAEFARETAAAKP